MPSPSSVCGDDDAFTNQMNDIHSGLSAITKRLIKRPETVCVECNEPIGEARKAAAPFAIRCIDCQIDFELT